MATINSIISRAVIANLTGSSDDLRTTLLNLSGGLRTNAGVADLAIGTILQSQSSTLAIANLNAGQGKSLLQTAKGALDEILDLLQEQKNLAVRSQDASLTDNERANLNTSLATITTEINRLATTTSFNNKNLLDGSISGTASLTSTTGQATENYTLLTTSDFSFSGTTAAGELDSTSAETFAIIDSDDIGKTAGTTTLAFTSGAVTGNATITINGQAISVGDGAANATQLATAFVAAVEASTNNSVRSFIYTDNGNGTVSIATADLGTAANGFNFNLTDTSGGDVTAATLGTETIVGANESITSSVTGTSVAGTTRTVLAADDTFDEGLEGAFSNFTADLDASGTQNSVTFTVDVNGTTYTSNAVTLFGTGGFNGKGNTIKNGQVLTFSNITGPTNDSDELTDNGFTLKIDDALGATDDIVIAGGSQDAFETDLSNTATGFLDQLDSNRINQKRSIILDETNAAGADFSVAAAADTTFDGIRSFDAEGTNTKGDINFVGDVFGDDGRIGDIGHFSFNTATNKLTVTIDGEEYRSYLSDSTADTGGLVNGAGSYNATTQTLTVGAGTIIVLHSESTTDGKQLRIDLSHLTDTSIDFGTTAASQIVTDDLDTLFDVADSNTLSFQIGIDSDSTIDVSLSSAKTTDIYLDDAGTSQTLDISTTAGAIEAEEVLDNAINTVLGMISSASAGITSFTSAIVTNNVMAQNFDASSSVLLNTDYALESTLYAEAALKVNAAAAALAQEQNRMNNIMKLLSLG